MLDTMRGAAGPDARLLTDANQNLGDWRNAASYMFELAEYEPMFIEEAIAYNDVLGYAKLREALAPAGIGVAGGEQAPDAVTFKQLHRGRRTHALPDRWRARGRSERTIRDCRDGGEVRSAGVSARLGHWARPTRGSDGDPRSGMVRVRGAVVRVPRVPATGRVPESAGGPRRALSAFERFGMGNRDARGVPRAMSISGWSRHGGYGGSRSGGGGAAGGSTVPPVLVGGRRCVPRKWKNLSAASDAGDTHVWSARITNQRQAGFGHFGTPRNAVPVSCSHWRLSRR